MSKKSSSSNKVFVVIPVLTFIQKLRFYTSTSIEKYLTAEHLFHVNVVIVFAFLMSHPVLIRV